MTYLKKFMKNQEGNALFLILIAVTLFAALSYAVTQSGRGSGKGASDDANLISSSQITQYPAAIRSGVDRLMIRGWGANQLIFEVDNSVAPTDYAKPENVFNPSGLAGIIPQDPPPNAVANTATAKWIFNKQIALPEVGNDATADVVAVLPGVLERVCTMLNDQIVGRGYFVAGGKTNNIPVLSSPVAAWGNVAIASSALASDETKAKTKAFLCVKNGTDYVYYHALAEL